MTPHIPELSPDVDTLGAALAYARAGWFVLPVDQGTKHAGSVLGKGWQHKTTRDADVIASWFAGSNYGLALHVGRSGAVAFDVDEPAASPRVLIDAVLATGAPHQATRVGSTGRGHYLFAAEPGSVGNSRGGLGGEWGEVRGLNGIIVVYPTPHSKADEGGQYRWERGGVLPAMPESLAIETRPPSGGADPASWGELREWLDSLPDGEPLMPVRRVDVTMPAHGRYDRMRDASMELVGYGVRGYSGVRDRLTALGVAYIEAVKGERPGGERTARDEFTRAVAGALHNVDDRPLPNVTFDPAPAATVAAAAPAADPFDEPASIEPVGAPVAMMLDAARSRLLTPSQVREMRPPAPLVRGVLRMDTLAWVIAAPGSFKSFVALDLAARVAAGLDWAGRPVRKPGVVFYIAAEGASGLSARIAAWEKVHGPMSEDVRVLPVAVQAANPEAWGVLVALVADVRPVLVIVDTQARISTGIKENDNTAMGELIASLDKLRRAAGSCVLVVHHTGRAGSHARGGSAIDGAQDTELRIERTGGPKALTAEIVIDKQKDGPDTDRIKVDMSVIDLGLDEYGDPVTSLVATCRAADPFSPDIEYTKLPEDQARILEVLRDQFYELGATKAELRQAWTAKTPIGGAKLDSIRRRFDRALDALAKADRLAKIHGTQRFIPADRGER